MKISNRHIAYYISIVILIFTGCGKKSTPTPTQPAPKTISGTYKIIKDELSLGGSDPTFVMRTMTDCETKGRYTFTNGNYTFVDVCDNETFIDTYTYNPTTKELSIIDKSGYVYPSTVSNLSDTGFLWTQPQAFGQTLRLQLSLVTN